MPSSDVSNTPASLKRDAVVYAAFYGVFFLLVGYRLLRDKVHTLVAYHAFALLALARLGAFVAAYFVVARPTSAGYRAAFTAAEVLKVFATFFLLEGVSELVVRWFAGLRSYSVTGLSQTRFVVYHLRHFILAGTLGIGVAGAVQRADAGFVGSSIDYRLGQQLLQAAGGIWLGIAVLTLAGAVAVAALPVAEGEASKGGAATTLLIFSACAVLGAIGAVWSPTSPGGWINRSGGTGIFVIFPEFFVLFGAFALRVDDYVHITPVYVARHSDSEYGHDAHVDADKEAKEEARRADAEAGRHAAEPESEPEAADDVSVSVASAAPAPGADDYVHIPARKRFGLKAVLHRKSDKVADAAGDAAATAAHKA
ncbi:hypothetical protein Q8F55_008337 [Vanrija albida]|uniref:Uncharacterized protein n=1 Tax=Vanrija albida TaxID=181172 RepID=A0ABR3PW13_9TREE